MSQASDLQSPMTDEYMEGYSLPDESWNSGLSADHSGAFISSSHPTYRNVSLSLDEQKAAMQSILDIFELDEELPDQNGGSDSDGIDADQTVDLEDQHRRTERLRGICPALDRLWWAGSEYMTSAAEKLADSSRDSKQSPS